MRAAWIVIFAVVVIAGVLRFYPSSTVEGGETGSTSSASPVAGDEEPGPRFLARDDPREPSAADTGAPPLRKEPREGGSRSRRGFGWAGKDGAEPDQLALAAALLSGTPEEVGRALDARTDLSAERRGFYSAFAHAMGGSRDEALRILGGIDENSLTTRERSLLREVLTGQSSGARPASAAAAPSTPSHSAPLAAMEMRLLWRESRSLLDAGEFARAARGFSELLIDGLEAPWQTARAALADWSEGLRVAQERYRFDPRAEWPSVEIEVVDGDSLTHIRKRYLASRPDTRMCTGLIARANRITGFIHPGETLRVPTARVHVLIDLSSRWVLYLHDDEVVAAWEAGIGREGEETITDEFVTGLKQEEPMWFPRGREPVPYPNNPLGTRWIGWHRDGEKSGYGIHGTWEPETIGEPASEGCIRLLNEHVEELFEILPLGAPILVRE